MFCSPSVYWTLKPVHPSDWQRLNALNSDVLSTFFATAEFVYKKYCIVAPWQVFNLDETGFTQGRDQSGKARRGVVTLAKQRAAAVKENLVYSHRISLLAYINAD